MYTPIHNREADRAKIIAFMRAYPFATLVTTRSEQITATHLPVLIDEQSTERMPLCAPDIFILAHVARGNVQWRDFSDARDALVIFQEPHAFVSTRHYERALSVPTWNYVAVHAYGAPRILDSLEERLQLVERMVLHFEGNLDQWNSLPTEFKHTKANGIVAFEMCVTRLDARFKLSQDRSRAEQENIVQTLAARADIEATIGEMMQERLSVA